MWSRDAASKDSDPIRPSEGIKAYALCPVFADTQLVRDSIKLYGKSKIEDLEKDTKVRVMDVSEVGHAFDLRLLGAIKVCIWSKKNPKESFKSLKIQKWTQKLTSKSILVLHPGMKATGYIRVLYLFLISYQSP